ncbi:hypothetical protein [Streptomyces sp. NPDC020747]|uniref:hypothetical protein n=1 Tax=Streptomyces sp. NPDC020747 TaxID=3365086 RepID=UPI003797E5B6
MSRRPLTRREWLTLMGIILGSLVSAIVGAAADVMPSVWLTLLAAQATQGPASSSPV